MLGTYPILIADDNDNDVFLLEQGFVDIKVKIDCIRVRDGQAAADMLLAPHSFRLALIDFYLPKRTGAEVVEILRTNGRSVESIVILTSHISEQQRGGLQQAGVLAVLEKPVDLGGFAQLAAYLLRMVGEGKTPDA